MASEPVAKRMGFYYILMAIEQRSTHEYSSSYAHFVLLNHYILLSSAWNL